MVKKTDKEVYMIIGFINKITDTYETITIEGHLDDLRNPAFVRKAFEKAGYDCKDIHIVKIRQIDDDLFAMTLRKGRLIAYQTFDLHW